MDIKFSKYFELWLNQIYYKNGANIGKDGDFYTSVSVGSMFVLTLAKHFVTLNKTGSIDQICAVVEIGANDGGLMVILYKGFTLLIKIC